MQEWGTKVKAQSPAGTAPFLEFKDGSTMGHSLSLYMYAGKLAGMVPEDPVALGRTIEIRESFEKVHLASNPFPFALVSVFTTIMRHKSLSVSSSACALR